ncbi:hypothetical protein FO519_009011 [Halicephalobus sp. NKZ332]|nr:hypothetical protein FO519_009011 [Halicephalobus sp. NKZ332]
MPIITTTTSGSETTAPLNNPPLNRFTIILVITAAVGGFLFGYDTGIVSSAMLYVENNSDIQSLSNFWKELIVSSTPGFAIIGALTAGPISDKFGRKPLILISGAVFTLGAICCGVAFDKWMLLFGRMLLGVAVGFASMIVSIYVGESSPKHIRGALLTFCNAAITFGQMAANIIAGGFSYIDPYNVGWRLMFGFAAIPAIIQFIGFLFLPESPRWLLKHGRETDSRAVLSKIYSGDDAWIEYETAEILTVLEQEKLEKKGKEKVLKRILTTRHIRRALIIGCALQAFQQLGGINTIMYYTGTIIKAAGVKDNRTTIWLSVITSGVNFVGTMIPLFLVDRLGRRKMLITSCLGVVLSLSLMGGAFLLVNNDTARTLSNPSNSPIFDPRVKNYDDCSGHSNCDYCVTDDRCGFCAPSGVGNIDGYCLPMNNKHPDEASSTGFCAQGLNSENYNVHDEIHTENETDGIQNRKNIAYNMQYNVYNTTSYEWADVYCHTKYTALPIVIMVIYLLFFSSGMGPVPWILNAEFYPIWARGTCVAIATATNWLLNLLVSLTFLTLTEILTKFGTFFFYALITFSGALIFFFFVPETKGKSLDEIEALFMDKDERKTFFTKSKVLEVSKNDRF